MAPQAPVSVPVKHEISCLVAAVLDHIHRGAAQQPVVTAFLQHTRVPCTAGRVRERGSDRCALQRCVRLQLASSFGLWPRDVGRPAPLPPAAGQLSMRCADKPVRKKPCSSKASAVASGRRQYSLNSCGPRTRSSPGPATGGKRVRIGGQSGMPACLAGVADCTLRSNACLCNPMLPVEQATAGGRTSPLLPPTWPCIAAIGVRDPNLHPWERLPHSGRPPLAPAVRTWGGVGGKCA